MLITPVALPLTDLPAVTSSTYALTQYLVGSLQLEGAERHLGTLELIDVNERAFSQALRISTRVGATQEWHVRVATDVTTPVDAGSVLLASFWVRCIDTTTGQGVVAFTVEMNRDAAQNGAESRTENLAEVRLSVAGEWVECFLPFEVTEQIAAGGARLCFNVGYDRQTIELGGITLINYGSRIRPENLPRTRLTYPGRAPTADWRAAAAERIERYRKGNLLIEVVDDAGKPVAGATVTASLRRHSFGFGTALSAKWINDCSPDGAHYRRVVASMFNQATFENDLKWPAVYDGVPAWTDQAVEWLRERQIQIRGHNLLWPSWRWLPAELQKYRDDPSALRAVTAEHVSRTVAHFRDRLIQWDVVNEPFSEHDLLDLLGRDVMIEWFKLARQADPKTKLFLNDYGIFDGGGHARNEHADHFYDTLCFLRDNGAPLDGIGIQSHFTADLPSPEALFGTLERFGKFGLPIESTELTINLEDRQLQAEYLRDYMTMMFSHPNVSGITIWGFWERCHWRPHSAFFNEDWSIRPTGAVFSELVNEKWSTRASTRTDHSGRASVLGYFGTYDIAVRTGDGHTCDQTADLDRSGGKLRVKVDRARMHSPKPLRVARGRD